MSETVDRPPSHGTPPKAASPDPNATGAPAPPEGEPGTPGREDTERAAAYVRGEAVERAQPGAWLADAARVRHAEASLAGRAFVALAENVRDYAIFLMDPDGIITFWGEGARLMKWWSAPQTEGGHLRMLYPDGGSEDGTAEGHLAAASERGEYSGEGQRIRNDGSTFWAGITLTALRDAEGRLLGFAKVTRDLTARRAADVLLQAATAASEEARGAAVAADRAKSGFLATMSHEIRTPINAIIGYHELLELEIAGPLSHGQHTYLRRAAASGRHLLTLIDEILDFSRVEADQLPVARRVVRVGSAVDAAFALVTPQAAARGLTLLNATNDFAANLAALGDESRVRQVLVNLLGNAVKFTEPGGRVTVSAGAAAQPNAEAQLAGEGPWVYVRVEDTGAGIAADRMRAVFEPFVQADMSLTREHGGTGLGLAISRRLARLMGGDVTARSEPRVGSAFFLWLPAATSVPVSDGAEAVAHRMRTDAAAPSTLHEVGDALLAEIEHVLHACVERIRGDAAMPDARRAEEALIEDHLATFLADVAATLSSIDPGDGDANPAEAARDGTDIQRLVAERHGAQRARLGWSEGELRREFAILGEELEAALLRRPPRAPSAEGQQVLVSRTLELLRPFVRTAEAVSVAAFHAAMASRE